MRVLMLHRFPSRVSGFPPISLCVTSHCTVHALHFTSLHTLHSTQYTLHISALHSTLHASYVTPYTPHDSTLYAPHVILYTLHFTLDTFFSTLHSLPLHSCFPVRTPHFTLCTSHSTPYTPHSTVYLLQFTLETPHYILRSVHMLCFPQVFYVTAFGVLGSLMMLFGAIMC